MRHITSTLTADVTLEKITSVTSKGLLQVGGLFGGGVLSFFISLDGGTTKNKWLDLSGSHYILTSVESIAFDFDIFDEASKSIEVYATLVGSTTPSITIKILDKQER